MIYVQNKGKIVTGFFANTVLDHTSGTTLNPCGLGVYSDVLQMICSLERLGEPPWFLWAAESML